MTISAQNLAHDLVQCEVADESGGVFTFVGRQIGHASTHEPDKLRWFEISIYWDDTHTSYVVLKVGKSVVYHRPKCEPFERSRRNAPETELEVVKDPPDDTWIPCPSCEPDTDFNPVALEQDRITLRTGLIALEVPEVLRQRDDDTGEWFLSNAARVALREATGNDEELMRVYAPRRARRIADA